MNPQGYQTGERAHEHKDADVINLGMIAGLLLLSLAISDAHLLGNFACF